MKKERFTETNINPDELFSKYMYLIGKNDSESIYRLKAGTGEGIMRRYTISEGVELVYSEIESYIPDYRESREKINYIEIMYMIEGHADFVMENRRCASASKGDVAIFNSRVKTKACTLHPGGMRTINIVFLIDELANELNRLFETDIFDGKRLFSEAVNAESCLCFPANEMLEKIFEGLMRIPERYGDYRRKLLTYQAIMAMLDINELRAGNSRYFSGDTGNKVHDARKLLGENLDKELTLEALSKKVRLNRTTLQRVFKQMYGVTVYEYRTHVRMQEAKNLLLDDGLSVTDIAGRCGYANSSKFAACFKKVTGFTPGEWRRR